MVTKANILTMFHDDRMENEVSEVHSDNVLWWLNWKGDLYSVSVHIFSFIWVCDPVFDPHMKKKHLQIIKAKSWQCFLMSGLGKWPLECDPKNIRSLASPEKFKWHNDNDVNKKCKWHMTCPADFTLHNHIQKEP